MSDPANGLGLPGRDRLARVESTTERIERGVGELKGQVQRVDDRTIGIISRLDKHDEHHDKYEELHSKRHRSLDFRWYGVVAGMGLAAAWVIRTWGVPT